MGESNHAYSSKCNMSKLNEETNQNLGIQIQSDFNMNIKLDGKQNKKVKNFRLIVLFIY